MQQNFEELEQPAQTLPVQTLPVEEQTELQKPRSLFLPRRRLGSKRKNALRRGQVLLLQTGAYGSMGVALFAITLVSLFLVMMVGVEIADHFHPMLDFHNDLPLWQNMLHALLFVSPVVIGACIFGGVGFKAKNWATHLDSKLLADSAGDLPASESLLRGSAEPVQKQSEVLLRAAGQGLETPAEQLLRATGEPKE